VTFFENYPGVSEGTPELPRYCGLANAAEMLRLE
jgi:hypothetical protein